MTPLFLDFETRSVLSLRDTGAYVYAEHPSTEVLCMAWAYGDGMIRLWVPGDSDLEWRAAADEPGTVLVAHNMEFEREIFRHCLGWATPVLKWRDTMAMAARMSLPRSLEEVAEALGLQEKKDVEGARVMMKLSRPRRDGSFWTPEQKPDDFACLHAYCGQDVAVTRELWRILPQLSERELEIWSETVEANARGILIDLDNAARAILVAQRVDSTFKLRFQEITGVNPNSAKKAAAVLGLDNLRKNSVRDALKSTTLSDEQRAALEIRQLQGRSSVKKIQAFVDRTSADGRLRGSIAYSGAERTQRWSSPGVQIQNMSGTVRDLDAAFTSLEAGVLDLVYDDVLGTLSKMLRGFLRGPFLVGDFAQIEARVTAWLAGQGDLLADFANKADPYRRMASAIYAVPPEAVTKAQREIGKRAILGCGYGMGAEKFRGSLKEQYGVEIDVAFAERTVRAYREKYSKIAALWNRLGKGFEFVVRTGKTIDLGLVSMGCLKLAHVPFAYVRLPSGRALFYAWPQIAMRDDRPQVQYFGRNIYAGGKWCQVGTWGGKVTENIVQAVSRDLLADVILRLRDLGFPLAFTVHDEIVVYGDPGHLDRFEAAFRVVPTWAAGLPLGVECFAAGRYRK